MKSAVHHPGSGYPETGSQRDRWILAQRGPRATLDPRQPAAFLVETERDETGETVSVATIFLTNRECPWRCLMCDLWKNTLTQTVPAGAIPAQIDRALSEIGARAGAPVVRKIKLYNSGSFFDPRAIPPGDYPAIAERVRPFARVIVESHPALVGDRCLEFRDLIEHAPVAATPRLEVAMGLETAHPEVLEHLNKRMTLEQFAAAADFLRRHGIALRVFVLVKPPFLGESEGLYWAERSIDFAFGCGASVVSLIPTRFGNGALEQLAARGEFRPPRLATLEAALEYGIGLCRGRVFADVWDLAKFADCADCFGARAARLQGMNALQTVLPPVPCERCAGLASR